MVTVTPKRPEVSLTNNVTEKSGGVLKCSECPGLWCAHIGEVIKQGQDRPLTTMPWDGDPGVYLVPVFPTRDVYLHVTIENIGGDYFKVVHMDETLGYISKYEGRRVIRNMLIDHLTGLMSNPSDKPKCAKLTHDFSAKVAAAKYEGTDKLIDYVCRSYYNSCLYCIDKATSGDAPDDDGIIPDNTGRGFPK